jgi:membrane associated rhomboid family serine protease
MPERNFPLLFKKKNLIDQEYNRMLPIGDEETSRRLFPVVTYALIALNFLVFFLELINGDPFIEQWSFIPSRFLANPVRDFVTLFTSMFMHAGWFHIGGNMLYLWIFGDNVEDRFGHLPYLVFFLLCGMAATFAQLAFSMGSTIPSLGASGAIAGVLGAYIVLFPERRITVLFDYGGVGRVPAIIVIGLWFILQLFSGIGSIAATTDAGGIAYMAHVGGFVIGVLLTLLSGGKRQD